MSSQMRVVRPFVGLDEFEAIVKEFGLEVAGRRLSDGESVRLDPGEFTRARIVAELAPDPDTWAFRIERLARAASRLNLRPDQLELVVTTFTPFLRMADVAWTCRLSELQATAHSVVLSASPRPRALQAAHHGATVEVCICLADDLAVRPLVPSRLGTWLSRATFRISTDFDAIGFRPRSLSDVDIQRLGLPPGTVRFVEVVGSPLEDLRADEAVDLWLDETLMARMSMASRTAPSRALQMQLFVDAVSAVAERARRELTNEEIDELDGTLLGRILNALAGAGTDRTARGRLLELLREHPARFLAHVEARIGLRRTLLRLVGDEP
jgi:hypothetical protein